MGYADLFVGTVSIVLGATALWSALFSADSLFHLPTAKSLQRRWGEKGARILFAVVGIVLVAMGIAVIAGFSPGWLGIPFLEPS